LDREEGASGACASHGAFLRAVFSRALLLTLGVAGLNLLVDPFGTFGTQVFEPVVLGSRLPKLRLYQSQATPPEIVILGSSRAFTMDPAFARAKTSRVSFNAAVHAAVPGDYLDLARCFEAGGTFPRVLIVGLGVEQLVGADTTIEPSRPLDVCSAAQTEGAARSLWHFGRLLTRDETAASLHSLTVELLGRPTPHYVFTADGVIRSSRHPPLAQALEESLTKEWSPQKFQAEALEPKRVEQIRQLLELSQRHGTHVIVYLPPFHPRALALYRDASNFFSLRADLVALLRSWSARYPLTFFDFSDATSFGGTPEMFMDASHPSDTADRLMLARMLADVS
jgi:hypothetical protein